MIEPKRRWTTSSNTISQTYWGQSEFALRFHAALFGTLTILVLLLSCAIGI